LAYRFARVSPLLEARSWLSLPVSRAAFAV